MIKDDHPGFGFFYILDPGSRGQKALDPGCGSTTLDGWVGLHPTLPTEYSLADQTVKCS